MTFSRPAFLLILPLLVILAPVWSDEAQLAPFRQMLRRAAFPENDESRRLLSDAISAPAYSAVEASFRIVRQRSDRRLVQFELRKGIRDWYLIFRNQRGVEPLETYPLWGRGTWIIKKDLLTGEFIQAKIFLQDDQDSFVRIFPSGPARSRLDIHLYGRQLADDVIVPVAFEALMFAPFARIVRLTDRSWDWNRIFPDPLQPGHRRVENLVETLRIYQERIVEIEDAAVDGAGRNVYIETGEAIQPGVVPSGRTGMNCSGYVKWVADGIFSSWKREAGTAYLDIPPLREPTSRITVNPWSESRSATGPDTRDALETLLRDPHFGLDWNRNIAYLVESSRIRRSLSEEEKSVLDTGRLPGIPYSPDMGYAFSDLAPALYQLASARPGSVYLAAINSRFVPEPSEDDPDPLSLHQYWHVSILAPWFDDGSGGEQGRFRVAVLDTGGVSESLLNVPGGLSNPSFPAFIMQKAIHYARLGTDDRGEPLIPEVMVHLVRMDIPPNFQPSLLPEAY